MRKLWRLCGKMSEKMPVFGLRRILEKYSIKNAIGNPGRFFYTEGAGCLKTRISDKKDNPLTA